MNGSGGSVGRLRAAAAVLLALGVGVLAGWNIGAPSARGTSAAGPAATPTATAAATTPPATPSAAVSPTQAAAKHQVVLFGDGLVDGYGLPDEQSLPVLLGKARPDLLLVDLGLGYETSDKLVARVRDATELHADAVVLWAGTYDAGQTISAQQYAANVGALLDQLQGTRVLLLPPLALPGGRDVAAYTAALNRVAAQHGLTVTDVSAALSSPDWQASGQDLGPRANAAMAALLARAL
jgi:lysophospholipase L1-like esterase